MKTTIAGPVYVPEIVASRISVQIDDVYLKGYKVEEIKINPNSIQLLLVKPHQENEKSYQQH